jgi:hypothetical protein
MNCANSLPDANVPEAVIMGFLRFRDPRFTLKSTLRLTADHLPKPRELLLWRRRAVAEATERTPRARFRPPREV